MYELWSAFELKKSNGFRDKVLSADKWFIDEILGMIDMQHKKADSVREQFTTNDTEF